MALIDLQQTLQNALIVARLQESTWAENHKEAGIAPDVLWDDQRSSPALIMHDERSSSGPSATDRQTTAKKGQYFTTFEADPRLSALWDQRYSLIARLLKRWKMRITDRLQEENAISDKSHLVGVAGLTGSFPGSQQ
ncbi:hypothetical protein MMC25_007393 [Agyrium rufum]|nr:hypothetical protein [Agyrium rufum]